MPARVGPLTARCRAAGARARVRPGLGGALLGMGLRDLGLLPRMGLEELTLLGDSLHCVPRLTGRWMLDLARAEGALALLAKQPAWTEASFLAAAGRELGWDDQGHEARSAARGLFHHLEELQVLAPRGGGLAWRGEDGMRDLALSAEDEVRARELFGGTLAFYRACLDGLPEVLHGKPAPLGFGREAQALWDGVLGSPEQLALRRAGLKAAETRPQDVLDLACGSGWSTACIVEEWVGTSIVAIDIADVAYPLVQQRAGESAAALGVPLDLTMAKPWPGWGAELPFPDASFDAVFFPMNDGFIPPHRRREAFAEMRRLLRPGGQLLVVTAVLPGPDWQPRPWELRAQTWLHHAAEFSVAGFQGLAHRGELVGAAEAAGLDARDASRLAGLVWVFRAPK